MQILVDLDKYNQLSGHYIRLNLEVEILRKAMRDLSRRLAMVENADPLLNPAPPLEYNPPEVTPQIDTRPPIDVSPRILEKVTPTPATPGNVVQFPPKK